MQPPPLIENVHEIKNIRCRRITESALPQFKGWFCSIPFPCLAFFLATPTCSLQNALERSLLCPRNSKLRPQCWLSPLFHPQQSFQRGGQQGGFGCRSASVLAWPERSTSHCKFPPRSSFLCLVAIAALSHCPVLLSEGGALLRSRRLSFRLLTKTA